MRKTHYRDYATAAFQLYAQEGSVAKYKQKINCQAFNDALKDKGGKSLNGSPVEAEVLRNAEAREAAEKALQRVESTLADLDAVERAMLRLELSRGGGDKMKALRMVYIQKDEIKRGTIQARVHNAEIQIPASERSIYAWLLEARRFFAEERELRL